MASLVNDPGGKRRIQFVSPDGTRRTIRLGKTTKRIALAFKLRVEHLVNAARLQSPIDTANIINAARANGIKSVSVDLIYGLPLQTPESFERTLNQVIELNPDRISLYSYAHLPNRFKTQRQINVVELRTADRETPKVMNTLREGHAKEVSQRIGKFLGIHAS